MKAKQFAVIGLGRFGSSIAQTLCQMGHEVLAIDAEEEVVAAIAEEVTHAVQVDSTNEAALQSLALESFDAVIVSIGQNMQASILTTLILKEIGVKYIVAKARTDLHGKVLYKTGATKVVYPERDMGVRVAHNLLTTNLLDFIELSDEYSIVEMEAFAAMFGKSLQELNLRASFGITVMAIKRESGVNISPAAEEIINEGDILIMVGENESLDKIESVLKSE